MNEFIVGILIKKYGGRSKVIRVYQSIGAGSTLSKTFEPDKGWVLIPLKYAQGSMAAGVIKMSIQVDGNFIIHDQYITNAFDELFNIVMYEPAHNKIEFEFKNEDTSSQTVDVALLCVELPESKTSKIEKDILDFIKSI